MNIDSTISQTNPTFRSSSNTEDPAAFHLQRLKGASVDFESLLVHQMLQSMEKTLESGGLVGSGTSGSVYSGILTQAIAQSMTQHQGLGLAEQLYQQTIQNDPELKSYVEAHPENAALRPGQPIKLMKGKEILKPLPSNSPAIEIKEHERPSSPQFLPLPQNNPSEFHPIADDSIKKKIMPLDAVDKRRLGWKLESHP